MEYFIEKLSDLKIIKVTVDGLLNLSQKKEIFFNTICKLNIYGYHRILFDGCKAIVSQNFESEDMLDMANHIKKFELPKDTKLAFLGTGNKYNHKTFGVFINIIMPLDIRSFNNYNKATNWLLHSQRSEGFVQFIYEE